MNEFIIESHYSREYCLNSELTFLVFKLAPSYELSSGVKSHYEFRLEIFITSPRVSYSLLLS